MPLQIQADGFAVGNGRLVFGARFEPWMGLANRIGISSTDRRAGENSICHHRVGDNGIGFILVDSTNGDTLAPVATVKFRAEVVELRLDPVVRHKHQRGQVTRAFIITVARLPLECPRNGHVRAIDIARAVTQLAVSASAREYEGVWLVEERITGCESDFVVRELALV